MKKTLAYIGLALGTLSLSSCGDFLDVKPVGKLIPTEVSEYENILNNTSTVSCYFMMSNNRNCFYAMMGDNLQVSENQMKYNYTATFANQEMIAGYIFYDPVLSPTSTPFTWTYGYKAVGLFNNVIDGVSGIDAESESSKAIIAQAKVGRAWFFLNMTLCYGPMYDPNGANDTKVIPFRSSGDPTVANGDLLTTAELFDKVKEDLDYACENCPLTSSNPCRANRACAYALRAEYYMYKRDWNNMLADSKKAWELAVANVGSADDLIYDLADFSYYSLSPVSPPEGCSPEYYMTLQGPDTDFDQTTNRENLLFRTAPYGSSTSSFYPSEDWKSLFDKDTDLRWKLFALTIPGYKGEQGTEAYDDGNQVVYERADNTSTTEALTHPLLLLTKAEAEARTNDLTSALASLNLLRRYRYSGDNTDLAGGASLTQDQLIEEILKERRREQPLVSFQRTLDLKRFALDSGKPWSKTTITHACGSKTYSKAVTDQFFQSLPIDNAVLEYNPQWGMANNTATYEPSTAK